MAAYLIGTEAHEIAATVKTDSLSIPGIAGYRQRFNEHLRQHGHAIFDLDFSKPVPAEAPEMLLETLKIYLRGEHNPYERQRAALAFRDQAEHSIAKRLDPLRRKYFLKWLKWAQDTAPLRENSIAGLGLGYPQIRSMLGELGRRLAAAGAIGRAEDVYWVELSEAEFLAGDLEKGETLKDFSAQVEGRKAKWHSMRRISPPTTLPKAGWLSRFHETQEKVGPP